MNMDDKKLKKLRIEFLSNLKEVKNINDINSIQTKYLGKNSEIIKLIKNIKNLSFENKTKFGKEIHLLKIYFLEKIREKRISITNKKTNMKLSLNKIDVTLPAIDLGSGNNHPITIIKNELINIFEEIGFKIISGTEVDDVKYTFELLDMDKNHPARNDDDCFYITNKKVLRTHSTNVTSNILSKLTKEDYSKGNIGIISTGNVFRRDTDDATHSHQFSQIDGVFIGDNISFANLKWVLEIICKRLFGNKTKVRMRPSFFPFTRLSAEVDINCFYCNSEGCKICKKTGWIEILGSGLLSRKVLDLCNVPKDKTALAFGIGIERIVMLKYLVDDIRNLYSNDINFLKQFKYF